MDLVGTWLRGAWAAIGLSMAPPAAILAVAAGVAIGGGGLGGLGMLGQVVSGPRAPAASAGGGAGVLSGDPDALPGGSVELAGLDSGGAADAGGDGGQDGDDRAGGRDRDGDRPGDRPTDPDARDEPGDAGGTGDPGAGGEPQQGPLRQLGETAKRVTDRLPGPLGPVAGGAVDEVVKVGEGALAPVPDALP